MHTTFHIFNSSRIARIAICICFMILAYYSIDIVEWFKSQGLAMWIVWGVIIGIFIFIEIALYVWKHNKAKHNDEVEESQPLTPLLDDQPTTVDRLGRMEFVRMLGRKIFSTFVDNNKKKASSTDKIDFSSAYAINIEEDYGYGKTSFLMMLHKWFEKERKGLYTWIEFKPWLCDNTGTLISEYFHQLAEKINIDEDLHKEILNYGHALARQMIQYSIGLQLPDIYRQQESSLKTMHDKIRKKLAKRHQLIVVTIDDLDRLDKDEVFTVLKLIRDTADFPNIFYITATEHTYLYNVLSDSGIKDPDLYIEKFFNLHFYLPAHEVDYNNIVIGELEKYLLSTSFPKDKKEEFEAIKRSKVFNRCFSGIRDVKRFINQLVMYLELLQGKEFNLYDAFVFAILQYKCPDIYKLLRDHDDKIIVAKLYGNDYKMSLQYNPSSLRFNRNLRHLQNGDTKDKTEEPIKHLSEWLGLKQPFRNELLGEELLNILFSQTSINYSSSIQRSNRYFLYFSGHDKKTSITKAEVRSIITLKGNDYNDKIKQLFKEGRNEAFLHELSYVISDKRSDAVEVIEKFYVYMDEQYRYYLQSNTSNPLDRFSYANQVLGNKLENVLLALVGDRDRKFLRSKPKDNVDLTPLVKQRDLSYTLVLVALIDRALIEYDYDREDVDNWMLMLMERLLEERLKTDKCFNDESLSIASFFRNESSYSTNWNHNFENYLLGSEKRVNQWLLHLMRRYESGLGWNILVRDAMFGDSYDEVADNLINDLTLKYNSLSEEFKSLKSLLQIKDLATSDIGGNAFINKFGTQRM